MARAESSSHRPEDGIATRELIDRYEFSVDDDDMWAIGDFLCFDGRWRLADRLSAYFHYLDIAN